MSTNDNLKREIKENECEHIKTQWENIGKTIYRDKYNWVDEEHLFKEPVIDIILIIVYS